jgi:hypothetical protein
MVRGIQGMANQHGIGFVGIQRAVGLIHQLVMRNGLATLQAQGLGKVHGLGRGVDVRHKVSVQV